MHVMCVRSSSCFNSYLVKAYNLQWDRMDEFQNWSMHWIALCEIFSIVSLDRNMWQVKIHRNWQNQWLHTYSLAFVLLFKNQSFLWQTLKMYNLQWVWMLQFQYVHHCSSLKGLSLSYMLRSFIMSENHINCIIYNYKIIYMYNYMYLVTSFW